MYVVLSLLMVAVNPDAPIEARYPEASEVFRCPFDASWDKNFDGWPDQWTRRRGKGFPQYVKVQISDEASPAGPGCLRIDLDGAGAVAYSPMVRVGSLYSYVLEGLLKTENLHFSRAWLSLTLLNEKRQLLETYTSEKIQDSKGWKKIRLGPVSPSAEELRLAVIGLHLEPGPQVELKGTARFADIWLGRLPRMALSTTAAHHFFQSPELIKVTCNASGFLEKDPPIEFRLEDALGNRIAEATQRLASRAAGGNSPVSPETNSEEPSGLIGSVEWAPPIPGPGFYRVRAAMKGQKDLVHRRELTLVVIEPRASPPGSEFGWSLPRGDKPLALSLLSQVVAQAGIARVKYPLWYGQQAGDAQLEKLAALTERLSSQGIELIGLLNRPPAELLTRFDDSTSPTAADVFTASPKVWSPSLEPVLTRRAGQVRCWQLGDDKDVSFVGYPGLAARIGEVKKELDRVAPDINLGIAWGWIHQLPEASGGNPPWRFLSLSADPPLTVRELGPYLAAAKRPGLARWVVLEPLSRKRYSLEMRVNDLVRQMMACKVHKAEGIFIADPFGDDRGLMNDDGTPSELFLPWRTAALMLGGAGHVGTVELPSGSQNLIFSRGGQATLVVWNRQPARETLYLGDDVRQTDPWGRTSTPATQDRQQILEVGPLPLFVTGVNEAIARWRMDFALERDRIPSIFGVRHKNSFKLKNDFRHGVSGTADLVAPDVWTVHPRQTRFRLSPGETFQQPFEITLPYDARSGRQDVHIDFEIRADRAYRFSVYRHIDVGLRDVYVEIATRLNARGELEVDQRFVNETSDGVSFTCELFVPDRQRQKTQITGLGQGRDLKTYRLPDGKQLLGKTLWLRAEELGGSRVLNYRFVAEP